MTNTSHDARRVLRLALAAVAAGLVGAAPAAATPLTAVVVAEPTVRPAPAAAPQGIIMRDGGICDPIRHIGC